MQHHKQDARISDKGDLKMNSLFSSPMSKLQLHSETFNCTSNLILTSSSEVRVS